MTTDFENSLTDLLSASDLKAMMASLELSSPTSIRLHPIKSKSLEPTWGQNNIPWCTEGKYLPTRPNFTHDPLFWAGTYYVQEASSMFLAHVLKTIITDQSIKVLDLCASPGGKSTLINSLISADSLLVANEVIKQRASTLSDNLVRWGYPNVVVTNNDPSHFATLQGFFDIIVVDAPCSGEGMFRKDKKAIEQWSTDHVRHCSLRQQRILEDALQALAPGGYLIYSTCTYNRLENEDNITKLIQSGDFETVPIPFDSTWGIVEITEQVGDEPLHAYRFYPHRVQGEGFFMVCLRKKGFAKINKNKYKARQKYFQKSKKHLSIAQQWVQDLEPYTLFHNQNQQLFVLPTSLTDQMLYLVDHLYIKSLGTCLGEIKGKDLSPAHDLAMSLTDHSHLPRLDLDHNQALSFLQKKNLEVDSTSKGWAIASHQGVSLGWVKVLHNRINNYYPKGLRILSDV